MTRKDTRLTIAQDIYLFLKKTGAVVKYVTRTFGTIAIHFSVAAYEGIIFIYPLAKPIVHWCSATELYSSLFYQVVKSDSIGDRQPWPGLKLKDRQLSVRYETLEAMLNHTAAGIEHLKCQHG